jgi:thiol-disulfide isomerase/thioredoxin
MPYSILYIGATWCGTCKTIKPQTETLAKKFAVPLRILDYDNDLEEEEKSSISKVPTLRIFEDDRLIAEYNVKQIESLETWLKKNISLGGDDF